MSGERPDGERFPDLFADAVTIAQNPYGVSLTFVLTDPGGPDASPGGRVVARVRLAPELARLLGDAMTRATEPARK